MTYAGQQKRDYQREWVARRRADFFTDKQCISCGSTEQLQLDHIDPSTKIDHKIWYWSQVRREVELAKCQVLCRPCHEAKTAIENSRPIPHGTDAGYTKRKCRCLLCREEHRRAKAEWRASRRAQGLSAP